jgi:hypothetical protein
LWIPPGGGAAIIAEGAMLGSQIQGLRAADPAAQPLPLLDGHAGAVVPAAALAAAGGTVPVLPLVAPVVGPPPMFPPAGGPPVDPFAGMSSFPAQREAELADQLSLVREALADLKLQKGRSRNRSSSSSKRDAKSKKKKAQKEKEKKKKEKEKRKKQDSDHSSSSRSSSASGSSSDSDRKCKYVRWDPMVDKTVHYDAKMLSRLTSLRFKRRSDLMNFSEKNPGALAGAFLAQVREKLLRGHPSSSKDLHRIDATAWATGGMLALKDIRDQREVMLLTKVLTEMGKKNFSRSADLVVQRIREIRYAKGTGGTWEKAEILSLLPGSSLSSNAPVPDGAFVL